MAESHPLETLVRIVVEDAESAARRVQDQALNEARRLVLEAEDRMAELAEAARVLGRTRGAASEAAEARAAGREIQDVQAGAFDALYERFAQRVRMALDALPQSSDYARALAAWAQTAATHLDGPAEVFCARRDRPHVYEALLAAGAGDFHVRVEHRVHVGFVVRDLEGRCLFDARPTARVEAHAGALRALLQARVPPPPAQAEVRHATATPRPASE